MPEHRHIVPENTPAIRLSDYGKGVFPGLPTKSSFRKAIKRGEILVDDAPATTGLFIKAGMEILWKPESRRPHKTYHLDIPVIFEDEFLAVVHKPPGIVVSGNRFRTLLNALPGNLALSAEADALSHPRPVHRLDASTSGLLIVAKTRQAEVKLGHMLAEREITKTYRAVLIGDTPLSWQEQSPVNEKEALTVFRKLSSVPSLMSGTLSLIEAQPHSGRKHQIRIHSLKSGFPVLGDKLYGFDNLILKGKGLFLCATGLKFQHPRSGETIDLNIETPLKFHKFMEGEKKRYRKWS
jgi:RluA family pseudouridine synthase